MNQMNDEGRVIETYNRGDDDTCAEVVRHWACGFKPGAEVLEIGFGRGAIAQMLVNASRRLYLVETSPTRLNRFQRLFPEELSEYPKANSRMFHSRTFDGVVVCGLTASMSKASVIALLAGIERMLRAGGRLLVVFPPLSSIPVAFRALAPSSRATGTYKAALWNLGLDVQPDLVDLSGNEYVCAVKHVQAGVPG